MATAKPLLASTSAPASAAAPSSIGEERSHARHAPSKPSAAPQRCNKLFTNILEYAGAGVIYSLLYVYYGTSWLVSRSSSEESVVQSAAWRAPIMLLLWNLHFIKRTLECIFIHKWTQKDMPRSESIMEWVYYLGFAFVIGYSTHNTFDYPYRLSPSPSTPPVPPSAALFYSAAAVMLLAMAGNGISHLMLSRSNRAMYPRGFLFEWVSCPHYFFEIVTWIAFAVLNQTLAALAFVLLGSLILAAYSHERHVSYRTRFDGRAADVLTNATRTPTTDTVAPTTLARPLYPPHRKALIPFIF